MMRQVLVTLMLLMAALAEAQPARGIPRESAVAEAPPPRRIQPRDKALLGAAPKVFYVTFNGNGLDGVSDPQWMRSVVDLETGLQNVGKAIGPKIAGGKLLTLIISDRGEITSSDPSIIANGTSAAGLLLQYGKMPSAMQQVRITIPPRGTIYWDPPIIFDPYPQLARRVAETTAKASANVSPNARVALGPPLVLTRDAAGRIHSSDPDRVYPGVFEPWTPFNGPAAQHTKYDEFKDCVGEYWYLPGVALVACAIGAGISSL